MKKFAIGVGILVILIMLAGLYLNHRNRTLSPSGTTSSNKEGFTVQVDYARPSVRGRLLFGPESEGALQPWGKYWRLGANEPTKLIVNRYFLIDGNKLEAGTYDMYAIPGENTMEIRINNGDRIWGATEPDYSKDLLKSTVPLYKVNFHTEQFTIKTEKAGKGILIVMMWGNYQWSVLVEEL